MRAFISGHLNLTQQQFDRWYRDSILRAIGAGHSFVVGDAPGADWMAQVLLHNNDVLAVTLVWCGKYREPRNGPYRNEWALKATGFSQKDKDRWMTEHSDYDIAVSFRKGSGTSNNLNRRGK